VGCRRREEVAQTMYTHVSKCKNDKMKEKERERERGEEGREGEREEGIFMVLFYPILSQTQPNF
jgi:hypothetical protein